MISKNYFEKQEGSEVVEYFRSNERHGLAEREIALRQKETGKNTLPIISSLLALFRLVSPASIVCLAIAWLAAAQGITTPLFWNVLSFGGVLQQILYLFVQYPTVAGVWKRYVAIGNHFPKYTTAIRHGSATQIRSTLLVPGDIIYLEAGEYVPCDVRVLHADGLIVDESFLFGPGKCRTGKNSSPETRTFSPYPANIIFGTSRILTGTAKAIVVHTTTQKVHDMTHQPLFTSPLLKGFYWQCGLMLLGISILLCIEYLSNLRSPNLHWFFLAIIPFYVPFYLFLLQYSTHKKDVSFPVGHILASSEHFIRTEPKNSLLFFDKEEIDLTQGVRVKRHASQITSFLELCYLSLPRHLFPQDNHPLLQVLQTIRTHLESTYALQVREQNSNLTIQKESSMYTVEQTSIGFQSKVVYEHNEEDAPLLTIHTTLPHPGIDHATYIWDSTEKQHKRRFFPNEKEKLKKVAESLHQKGYLLYSLSFEEPTTSSQKTPVFTYIGFIAVPQGVQQDALQELHTTQQKGLKTTLVSYTTVPTQFYAEKLGISLQNIIPAESITAKSQQYKSHLMDESLSLIVQSTSDVLHSLLQTKQGIWIDPTLQLSDTFSTLDIKKGQLSALLTHERRSLLLCNQFQLLCLLSSAQTITVALLCLKMTSLPYMHLAYLLIVLPVVLSISLLYSRFSSEKKLHELPSIRPSLSFSSFKTVISIITSILGSLLLYSIFVLSTTSFDWSILFSLDTFSRHGSSLMIWAVSISIPVVSYIFQRYITQSGYIILALSLLLTGAGSILSYQESTFSLTWSFSAIVTILCLLLLVHVHSKSIAHMGSK